MHRSQQRTSARCRIAIVVLSLAVAVGTASAQHGGGQDDRDVYRNQRGPVAVARSAPYARVPYDYGTPHYAYHPYYYYPYAYAWGPEPAWTFFAPSLGSSRPPRAEAVVVNGKRGYYYFGSTYYQQTPTGFAVVAPNPGMIVESLPQDGKEVRIGAQAYVQVGNTYYEPIQRNGKDMWQVVETPQSE